VNISVLLRINCFEWWHMTLRCCSGNTVLYIVLTWIIWGGLFQQLLWLPSIPGAGLLTLNNLYSSLFFYWDLNAAQAPDWYTTHTTLQTSTLHYKHPTIYLQHTLYTHTHKHTRYNTTHTRASSARLSLIQYEISSTFCHEIIIPKPNPLLVNNMTLC